MLLQIKLGHMQPVGNLQNVTSYRLIPLQTRHVRQGPVVVECFPNTCQNACGKENQA